LETQPLRLVHLGHFPKNLRKIDRKRRLDITGKLLILDPASATGSLATGAQRPFSALRLRCAKP
jgi:hypothetical protein